eukprot:scaffold157333_cov21-Tisochrysis_lutea.AAC.1
MVVVMLMPMVNSSWMAYPCCLSQVHSFNTSLEQAPGAMCNRTCSNNKPKHCAQKSNKLQDAHHTAQLTLPSGLHV